MRARYAAIALSVLVGSCAASEDGKSKTPGTGGTEAPKTATIDAAGAAPSVAIVPSIASVRLVQDCPDPKTEVAAASLAPSAGAPSMKMKMKRSAKSDSAGSFHQPCSQSTAQLAFTGAGEGLKVTLKEVRLMSAASQPLAVLAPRLPTLWQDSGYQHWDGVLPSGTEHKASYKLSLPDWSAVEATLGGSSFGPMYLLEIDVEINGSTTTIQSPQFERGRREILKT